MRERAVMALTACCLLTLLLAFDVDAAAVSGSCPPAVALRQCSPTCKEHSECPGAKLCCSTVCGGTACVRAVTDVRTALQQHNDYDDTGCCPKRGECPAVSEGAWLCSDRCRGDFDCEGVDKCCLTRCGAMDCVAPSSLPVSWH
ncbi:hypothetical protein ONE63_009541 [Megalurothrips usitatus]|uniref:WAP domain-containing protein n=1 Tax=Megalurothrips usitatus TaxID=439358 RepID=A0AAV7XP30_9NEOP|nr:hypothetical protein ONE63_009541 [Megalurothrips usitatus]